MKETEWSRKFQVGPSRFEYESKFLNDGFHLEADDLITRWPNLTSAERHDFALAFQCKSGLSTNDERILTFLMQNGDEIVWMTIASMLCRHSDRESVIHFLLERIEKSSKSRTNYYQAIEILGDSRFLHVLEPQFESLQESMSVVKDTHDDYKTELEFIQLCRILWILTNDHRYEGAIRMFSNHRMEFVRQRVNQLLER
ncbi:MAG TPA: hypothetical protein VGG46_06060 [Terriglobales bacterium]